MGSMPVTRTRDKLNEAWFFLTKLDEHYFDHIRGVLERDVSPPAFAYYLSAFVSAARSVTWVMRHEYSRVPGWEDWFRNQKGTNAQRTLLKLFNDPRVRSEKIEPLPLGHSVHFVGDPDAPEPDPRLPRFRITISTADDGCEEVIHNGEAAAFLWTLDEFEGEDLLPACREYANLLASLVQECEERFDAG